ALDAVDRLRCLGDPGLRCLGEARRGRRRDLDHLCDAHPCLLSRGIDSILLPAPGSGQARTRSGSAATIVFAPLAGEELEPVVPRSTHAADLDPRDADRLELAGAFDPPDVDRLGPAEVGHDVADGPLGAVV